MATKSAPASARITDADVDPEIARYESMSTAELDQELSRFGIDPRPTIASVSTLVKSKIAEWERRKKG